MSKSAPVALLLLGVLVVGCSSTGPASSPSSSLPRRPSASLDLPATVPPSPAPVTGEVPASVLESIRQRLAEEAPDSNLATVTVVRAEAVQWPDGSLGCPERGVVYTQAIVPGYHVVFAVDGREYDYRVTETGSVRRCEGPGPIGS